MRLRKRRGNSREKRIDKEHDMVIVPSDGEGCISGSESDWSDWSIGWLEQHPHDFCNSDGESEDSFAVLVPCYRHALANPSLERVNAGFSFGVRILTHEDLPGAEIPYGEPILQPGCQYSLYIRFSRGLSCNLPLDSERKTQAGI